MSKGLMVIGCCGLAFAAYRYMMHSSSAKPHYGAKSHKLGASSEVGALDDGTTAMFKAMSLAIWGLVVSKAKSGLEAATKSDEQSVGAIVKKVGIFTALIAVASVCQLMGQANTPSPVEAVTEVSSSSHKLQASRESHPASYYDKSSSHYMGGAHNVLLNAAKEHMKSGKALIVV